MAFLQRVWARIKALPLFGKIGVGLVALVLLCCICSIPVALLNPAPRTTADAPTSVPAAEAPTIDSAAAVAALPTAAPEPTAIPEPTSPPTAEPSATPVPPTEVPTAEPPTPEPPTAVPENALTEEEQTAVLAIGKHITAIGGALAEIGKLAQNYENTGAWKSRMVVQMALVRFSHQQILALEVPPKIGAVRAATLNATTDCDAAMDKLASGIDNDSAKDLSAAGKLMQSCGEKIKDVMPELQALQQ